MAYVTSNTAPLENELMFTGYVCDDRESSRQCSSPIRGTSSGLPSWSLYVAFMWKHKPWESVMNRVPVSLGLIIPPVAFQVSVAEPEGLVPSEVPEPRSAY